jgi:ankyrin repeat protein
MALICAVVYGHADCVQLLLQSGADKDTENDVCDHDLNFSPEFSEASAHACKILYFDVYVKF